jgi:hypothetical protein
MSDEVFLVPWPKAAKLLGCTTRTLDRRAATDVRFKPTIIGGGGRKYLRSSQIEGIQRGLDEDRLLAVKAGVIIPTPKASPLDRIGAIELEAQEIR